MFDTTQELYRLLSQHLARSVSQLYQDLHRSGIIQVLATQLPGVVSGTDISTSFRTKSERAAEPFNLFHVFVGEFPDGPTLRLTANRQFGVTQIDYLDENGARVASEALSSTDQPSHDAQEKGQQLEIPIDHKKLIQIHNLKPRTGYAAIPMQIRLYMVIGRHEEARTITALLQPSFKNINGTSTYFMKMVG